MMDAKPQRPSRAFTAASGNENILSAQQSVHQRHKSVGNLKVMATTGALNAPARRTAFGDVSNTARGRVVELVGKEPPKARVKPAMATVSARDIRLADKENKVGPKETRSRANTASKAGVHGPKSQANTALSTKPLAQVTKPATRAQASNQQHTGASLAQPPLRNGVSKKITAVYNDRAEQKASVAASPVDDLAALVVKPVKNPRHYKSQPVLRTDQHNLRPTQGKFTIKRDDLIEAEEEGDIDDDVTEAAYEDAVERLSQDVEGALRDARAEAEQAERNNRYYDDYDAVAQGSRFSDTSRLPKALPDLPVGSEPEEYWDDEEEQDFYDDEQGYTTAHSYRSHGDNTTSGPTVLLAPHVTTNVRRELDLAEEYVRQHQTPEEIEEESWDVSMVAEYGEEIFSYMRDLEDRMLPNAHYMDIQTEIQWSMRSVLMDWLVQVHHRFALLPETLFLTVNYIDRFLSVKIVSLGKLQLVGATALFVAAKYEEINCPSVQEIVYMVDSGYTIDEILKAERFMLSMLQFELGWPGPMSFLRRISKADDYELETRTLAKYFLEITIMDERFVSSPPSFLAAGAHCISRLYLDKGEWTPAHVHYSGYTFGQLKPLMKMMYECCQDPRKHHGAVFDKYASSKYKHAATFVEGKMASGMTLSQLYAGATRPTSSSSLSDDDIDGPYMVPRHLIPIKG